MENKETVQLALTWSEQKVFDGKSFDDKLTLDGIPLGWFYKKFFLPNVIPQYVNPTKFICMKKKMNLFYRTYFSLNARLLPLLLLFKERRKMKVCHPVQSDDNSKVLFLSYSNHVMPDGKIFRLQNIIDDIEKDKQIIPLVLFAEPLSSSISVKNTVYQYCSDVLVNTARAESKALKHCLEQLPQKELSDAFSIGGTSVFKEYAAAYRMYFSRQFLFVLCLTYQLCKSILDKEKIRAIVLTSPNSIMERCLIAAASKKKIPVIVIQHGIGMGRLVDKRIPVHFAVFGDFHAQQLLKNGALAEQVHKVGPVIFDDIINHQAKQEKVILIATAPIVEDNECSKTQYFTRVETILKQISSIADVTIVVKLHPRERYWKEYAKIISRHHLSNVALRDQRTPREEFYRLMGICSSFVHFGTTAALEVMILNKPVVTINLRDSEVNSPLSWLEDASIFLNYNEDIKSAVERSLKNEQSLQLKRKKYIQQFCGKVDGKSHLRVAQLIYSLTCQK
ncbi:MAG TPA: hypothetical protein VJK72_01240 [Candidatus Nanoarchaeia archaeon]|nr:hypothetical protein [Candidatus Nanoarchaeia archaeon]